MAVASQVKNVKESKKPKKPIFKLGIPHEKTPWQTTTAEEEKIMLEMLCRIIQPIGEHRRQNRKRGQEARQRARATRQRTGKTTGVDLTEALSSGSAEVDTERTDAEMLPVLKLAEKGEMVEQSAPSISKSILVGFNSVHHHLEALVSGTAGGQHDHMDMVFIPASTNDLLLEHLPLLATIASQAYASSPVTRLIRLTHGAEAELVHALGIARVSMIGILESAAREDAAVISLRDFVRARIEPVSVPYLGDIASGKWAPTKILEESKEQM